MNRPLALSTRIVATAIVFSGHVDADTFVLQSSKQVFEYRDGFRVVQSVEADARSPADPFSLEIFSGPRVLAKYPGIHFDHLFASPDESLFIGLSNGGVPGSAVVIFNREGVLRLLIPHGAAAFEYCVETVTIVRKWYDDKSPDVRFDRKRDEITLRDCAGRRAELISLVYKKSYSKSYEQDRMRCKFRYVGTYGLCFSR